MSISAADADRREPKAGDFLAFESLPPGGPLNRWSQKLTRGHDYPGSQVRLSAQREEDQGRH